MDLRIKNIFKTDLTYKEMTEKYETGDGIIAVVFYLFLLLLYLFIGVVLVNKGVYIGIPANILLIIMCIIIVLVRKQNVATIGLTLKNIGKSSLYGLVFGLLMSLINIIPAIVAKTEIIGIGSALYNIFYYFIIIGFSEEIVFRGFIQTRLYGLIRSDVLATIIGGVMFGVMHVPFQMYNHNVDLITFLQKNYWMVLTPFLLHFLMNFLYRKFNSIAAPTIFHGILNFTGNLFR